MGCIEDSPKKREPRKITSYKNNQNNKRNPKTYQNKNNEDKKNEEKKEENKKSEKKNEKKEEERVKNEQEEVEEQEENEEVAEEGNPIIPERNNQIYRQFEPYLQTKHNPNFDFPELKNGRYVGKGLRKMKGYISNITKEELKQKRIAFWGTRVEGNSQTWSFLKELCEMPIGEENDIAAMLQAYDLKPLLNCINITYDNMGGLYEIPNYCINEPSKYDLPESHVKKPQEKIIEFSARKGLTSIKLKVSNNTLVEVLKEEIAQKLETTKDKIRLFFAGKELKNGNSLWMYNVDNDVVIIIMVK